jgi:DNA sulfur modification protein DndC
VTEPIPDAIGRTREALEKNADAHWIIGFSGGKDSTALLKVFYAAATEANPSPKTIDVIYCDTGVENPALDIYVKSLFRNLDAEFAKSCAPFRTTVLKAPVSDRFFVKVIGRGYPPPTNAFRWCTKNLRIRPVAKFIQTAASGDAIVALGMRQGESQQRDRSLHRSGDTFWQKQIESGRRYRLFLPILDLDVYEVWDAVFSLPYPRSIDSAALAKLYRGASGECPLIKAPEAAPCASGRFGCWTCTVVRHDRSARALIEAGHMELQPYLEFRDWLAIIRNDKARRWCRRRNGVEAPGPFTLTARHEILERLEALEKLVGTVLLPDEERQAIQSLWALDKEADQLVTATR